MTYPDYEIVEKVFHHIILEGSSYEIGQQLARYNRRNPSSVKWFTETKIDPEKFGFENFESLNAFFEEYCPGIGEEIQGFCDELGLNSSTSAFYAVSCMAATKQTCSQLAILPSYTKDNQFYLGRSYEWNLTEDDLLLCTTRVKGKVAHLGMSGILFGRLEGMNEHGLVVSTTGGGIFDVPLSNRGPAFWVLVRSFLENCRDVKECMQKIPSLPLAGHFNILFADKSGNAELVEVADGEYATKQPQDDAPYLCSLNHYMIPEMEKHNEQNCGIIHHSKFRLSLIESMLNEDAPAITKDNIRKLFATSHPRGLTNHFYDDAFGTIYSMLIDIYNQSVDICFSAPSHNEYRTFNLDGEAGITAYPVVVPKLPWTTYPI